MKDVSSTTTLGAVARPVVRAQARATSADFRTWTPQVRMTYSDTGTDIPSEQLYTSQVQPYFRAPHLYISLPGRFMPGRRALTPERAERLGESRRLLTGAW